MRLTIRYLLDTYGWDKCIKVFGWDEWFLAEGKALDTDEQYVSEDELKQLAGMDQICPTCHQRMKA